MESCEKMIVLSFISFLNVCKIGLRSINLRWFCFVIVISSIFITFQSFLFIVLLLSCVFECALESIFLRGKSVSATSEPNVSNSSIVNVHCGLI